MDLSSSFQVDPRQPWVERHNREVREVWAAFKADRPIRVPLVYSGARTQYLVENGIDYRRYYEDPEEMFRLQLEWKRRELELPLGDVVLCEAPDRWTVSVDFHPVATAASFGCPVVFRRDAVPAHHSAQLPLDQCRDMAMPDLLESGLLPRHREFTEHFDRLCAGGRSFLGRLVERSRPTLPSTGGGIFSTALDIRGPEIMADMYEDPGFVHAFLERLAEWQIGLHRAWHRIEGMDYWMDKPGDREIEITDHGIDMLSAEMYDTFVAALILKLARKYGHRPRAFLHHCGRGTHLFPTIRRRFGLTTIHALTWPGERRGPRAQRDGAGGLDRRPDRRHDPPHYARRHPASRQGLPHPRGQGSGGGCRFGSRARSPASQARTTWPCTRPCGNTADTDSRPDPL